MERSARYRAPAESGRKLVAPPWSELGALIAANMAWRARSRVTVLGRPLGELTAAARAEMLKRAAEERTALGGGPGLAERMAGAGAGSGPWIVTGHQPGPAHPGVWVKNFAAARLAAAHGGVGIHVTIDGDLCQIPSILVPGGTVDAPRATAVEWDRPAAAQPWEERRIVDEGTWATFPERVREASSELAPRPFLDAWWPAVQRHGAATGRPGPAFSRARQEAELAWGCANVEVTQSQACQTGAFRWFAADVLSELPRFAAAYNGALADYRRAHHVRNHAHPAPNLGRDGGWLEAPFWLWTSGDPRRRAVWARPAAGGVLVTDRGAVERLLPTSAGGAAAAEALGDWEAEGVKLRSRALVTTCFLRLAAADVFLHGIGGAKYDEATDLICARFYGAEPPAFATVSGTLRLPIAHAAVEPNEAARLRQALRELEFHPERAIDGTALGKAERERAAQLAAEKRQWASRPPRGRDAAERHAGIVAANRALAELAPNARRHLEERLASAVERERAKGVLESREYASCLFPPVLLEQFLLDFSPGAL